MVKLFLYNTLRRKKEEFRPIKKARAGLYTCGPTVYNFAHLGNLRSYVFADLLTRILRYNLGLTNVKWVMNITDVDDKTIRNAKMKYPDLEPRASLKKFTAEFEKYFWQDLAALNISKPDYVTHAADEKYINKMKNLIKNIFTSGYAYVKDGSVYFDVIKYGQKYKYGQLAEVDVSKLKPGVRVDADEYGKDNAQDFVLWKGRKENEPSWDFELNGQKLPGRPGWHIECSAMAEAELGTPFDIHTGGVDLKFPHHENEIHQSVVGYKVKKPVNYWLHNEHLLVDGQRMGKRFNNFYTLKDLAARGINPLAYRFLCLQTGYGKVMNFTWEALKAADEGLKHLYNQVKELRITNHELRIKDINVNFKKKFLEAVNDDLNMPRALAAAQELFKSDLASQEKLATVLDFDKVLGLNLASPESGCDKEAPAEIKELVNQRERARQEKNWPESDRLRAEIKKSGWNVEDTSEGQRVSKK
ncbi:cysteine--tRNA ligase [Candidatus Falkowbacteria bacterium RIFCSPLOWO2_12_FULL_45_13]|uniref:Cysteine--tRNA ligase n=2 Tax=Candidatus Falkowiibacteriota TaxID=1752728 RepID=A0A1F5SD91_9BACT|nr:MAG: cysteine--tRNA ligase [Candidatus Falkowbacteria bacterium RIFCSPLOWO2_02_FULL_45_21]OGF30539.1 MAG: cysteine--tRNA ligase [Candidatus Falkowbacteria bacterium RIFCSPLOWO2_12_FULL_45_13]